MFYPPPSMYLEQRQQKFPAWYLMIPSLLVQTILRLTAKISRYLYFQQAHFV